MTHTQSHVFISNLRIVPEDPHEPVAEVDAFFGCLVHTCGFNEACNAPQSAFGIVNDAIDPAALAIIEQGFLYPS